MTNCPRREAAPKFRRGAPPRVLSDSSVQHIQTEGALFEAVQLARLFPDSKTFVDAVPLFPTEEIQAAYDALLASGARFDLRAQLELWFELPIRNPGVPVRADSATSYIERTWERLTRTATSVPAGSTMLALPHPFLVPGGRFDECFYWDSYFTALGLVKQGRTDLVQGIVDNLVHLQQTVGLIPNGSRTYLATRSQPPVLSLLVGLLADPTRYVDALLAEHALWTSPERTVIVGGVPMSRYLGGENTPRPESFAEDVATNGGSTTPCSLFAHLRAGAESGWDFSSRWLDNPDDLATIRTEDVLPIDLNCLLALLEHSIAALGDRAGRNDLQEFRQRALRRAEAILTHFFDPDAGWFTDLEASTLAHRPQLSLAGMVALAARVADGRTAERTRRTLIDRFLAPGGLRTTLRDTTQQWDGRNGWAPLQWWAIDGLRAYGFTDEAETVRTRWLRTCDTGFAQDGVLLEKYDVDDPGLRAEGGEYEVQEGFGWTNGVYIALSQE